jgi:hypothetical protein
VGAEAALLRALPECHDMHTLMGLLVYSSATPCCSLPHATFAGHHVGAEAYSTCTCSQCFHCFDVLHFLLLLPAGGDVGAEAALPWALLECHDLHTLISLLVHSIASHAAVCYSPLSLDSGR